MQFSSSAFIGRLDRPGTLFYLDPPYYGNEGDYGRGLFSWARFEGMAEQLARLKGRFLLSLNDHPDIRQIFARSHMTEIRTTYSIGSKKMVDEAGRVKPIISSASERPFALPSVQEVQPPRHRRQMRPERAVREA